MFKKEDLEEYVREASWSPEDVKDNPEEAADLIRELLRDRRILEECISELNMGLVWTDLPEPMQSAEVGIEEITEAVETFQKRYEEGFPPRGKRLEEIE